MGGPWEDYQDTAVEEKGPWDEYADVPPKKPSGATRSFEVSPMAEISQNLERVQNKIIPKMPPEELARAAVEGLGMAAGAGVGAMIPVPGTSLVGAGLGYAAAKRLAQKSMNEQVDTSITDIGKDVALGAVLQGGANLIGRLPGAKNMFAPEGAAIGPKTTLGKDALDRVSYAMMEKAMKVPPSVKPPIRERVIETALSEEVPISKGGLSRVKDILSGLVDEMDTTVAQSAAKNTPIATDSILGPVKDLRSWVEKTVGGNKLVGKLDKVVDSFKKQYGDTITIEQAQEIKQNTNAFLKKAYGELKPVETEATKQIVRGLKNRIALEIPEIAGVNAKYGDLKNLETALERAVNRTGNWDWFSLSAGMAGTIVGGATGSILKASEAVTFWRILKSPRLQSRLAIMLRKMGKGAEANAIADTLTTTVFNKITQGNTEATE